MGCNSCKSTPCCCRAFRGPKGPAGNRGPTGPTGPTGPAGTISTQEATGNPAQALNGAQADVSITGATLALVAGTYVVLFEADVLNNSDSSDGTYTLEVGGVAVATTRNYEPAVGVNAKGTKKFVIHEVYVSPGVGTLTVSVTQTAGEITIKRFTLITMKTA
jgi:hypothetical protein